MKINLLPTYKSANTHHLSRLARLLVLVALPVFAATPLSFEEVDTDGDGLVSADEAANVEGLDFDAADSDKDGTLTVDEYEIAVGKWALPSAIPPPTYEEQESASATHSVEAAAAVNNEARLPTKSPQKSDVSPKTAPQSAPTVPETKATSE